MKVYLAGPMTLAENGGSNLREGVAEELITHGIKALDPCRPYITSEGVEYTPTCEEITERDLRDIDESDAVLLLGCTDEEFTSIGTALEIGYCHALGVAVIWLDVDRKPNHPMINHFLSKYSIPVNSIEDAATVIACLAGKR